MILNKTKISNLKIIDFKKNQIKVGVRLVDHDKVTNAPFL